MTCFWCGKWVAGKVGRVVELLNRAAHAFRVRWEGMNYFVSREKTASSKQDANEIMSKDEGRGKSGIVDKLY